MSRILVIDDMPDARMLVSAALEPKGHEVVHAKDGEAALDILGLDDDFDLVLLDITMPRMNGWEVLAELANRGVLPSLNVVMFSSHADQELRHRAIQRGASGYLAKPYKMHELLAFLEDPLARREQ